MERFLHFSRIKVFYVCAAPCDANRNFTCGAKEEFLPKDCKTLGNNQVSPCSLTAFSSYLRIYADKMLIMWIHLLYLKCHKCRS